ncbi:hypothetical protein B0T14DRAFT_584142 [Immersiella caudata]|uniref:Uncharacterized protein n=1 Tax=Immersiella caudata TaxID=314043 RepID=A0AA40BZ86_9PEZI|nr:hypothetical protein B0T14DRAFT_584142 [Immersiella caudata]
MSLLVVAGANRNLQNSLGHSPILVAAGVGNQVALRHLYFLGAAPDIVSKQGEDILSITAMDHGLRQLRSLRMICTRGIDPDRPDSNGCSALQYFKRRMLSPWLGSQRRPTQAEVFTFYALILETRRTNWEAGIFLYSKEALETQGQLDRLRGWLGWQLTKIFDDHKYADRLWDPEQDKHPDEYINDSNDATDYDTSILFAKVGEEGDTFGQSERSDMDQEEMDEFFDALS